MNNSRVATVTTYEGGGREVAPVKWGPAYSGALLAVALFGVFSVFWLALAYAGSGSHYFQSNLHWYLGGTALVAWFLGGMMTGRVVGAAAASSATVMWALTVVGALLVVVPMEFSYLHAGPGLHALSDVSGYALWITFGATILGLGAAALGAATVAAPLTGRSRERTPRATADRQPRYAPRDTRGTFPHSAEPHRPGAF